MGFNATLDSARILRAAFEAISFLIDETYLHVSPKGIKIKAMDPSHVAMLLANFSSDIFTEYTCDEDFKIGVNIQDLIKILRRAKSTDQIRLSTDDSDKNTVSIQMKTDKSTRTFKLKSKDIQNYDKDADATIEKLDQTLIERFNATIQLEGSIIDEVIKDALIISDIIKVQVLSAEQLLTFQATDETGEVQVELDMSNKGSGGILDAEVKNDCEGMYSLNYLENIIKIQPVVSSFEIGLGLNIPVRISGTLTNTSGNPTEGKIVYILAPRVEDEEDDYADDVDVEEIESFDESPGVDVDDNADDGDE